MDCLIVSFGGKRFGIPCDNIAEVLAARQITTVPGTAPDICGIYHLRSRIMTSLTLNDALSLAGGYERRFDIVLRHDKNPVYSFAVEKIDGVEVFLNDELTMSALQPGVMGFFNRPAGILPVLDVPAILGLFENERILA